MSPAIAAKNTNSQLANWTPIALKFSILTLSLLLSACGGWQIFNAPVQDGAGHPVDISTIPDALPIYEPITRAGNTSPYTQFGKTYYVLPTSEGYRETGIASWYGSKFHGRLTSNGEIYNMYAMTAAHKTLPIPTYARVTNLDNNRSVIVKINDRGPFHEARIIDVSYVAALKLGFADQGTAPVLVEALRPPSEAQNTDTNPSLPEQYPSVIPTGHYLQAGSFDNEQSAKLLAAKVRNFTDYQVSTYHLDSVFKVWIGPITESEELNPIKRDLYQRAGISCFTVKPDP